MATREGQACRVCRAPAVRGWLDGWYCAAPECLAQRVWGRLLQPLPGPCTCLPSRCYCGWGDSYLPDPQLASQLGARLTAEKAHVQGLLGPPPDDRLGAAVMAAAARARAAGRMAPSEPVVTITEPRVQLSDDPAPTSLAAAMDVLPRTGTQRRAVLDALLDAHRRGYGGATDPELQRHLRLSPNSERPRRVELVDAGLVADSGATREHQGHAHTVWAPTALALRGGA